MDGGHYSLNWNDFTSNMRTCLQGLLESNEMADVTLAAGGKFLKAHKLILSICSPYFRDMFEASPCKHPIVFMKDVSYVILNNLLQFMYKGEVVVAEEEFDNFIATAEALKIKGLMKGDELSVPDQTNAKPTPVKKISNIPKVNEATENGTEAQPKIVRRFKQSPAAPAAATPSSSTAPQQNQQQQQQQQSLKRRSTDSLEQSEPLKPRKIEPSEVVEEVEPLKEDSREETVLGIGDAEDEDEEHFDEGGNEVDYACLEEDGAAKAGSSSSLDTSTEGKYKFVVTLKGRWNLVLNQHLYRAKSLGKSKKEWMCAYPEGHCSAKVFTEGTKFLYKKGTHNHGAPVEYIAEKESKGCVRLSHLF